ncbi:aminotransferase class V-fold PLP-dependent enzyme [Halanaeroarchaeum sulfurireducens]|uniref:Cysteine desulfurase n=1 Tax=Halanaeroarchaeum sulfurireducens TaxID=1604004 RepID=A0A0N9MZ20_9EURY|nr:SufS family cysteine desulfurase [Halanaeroarchaeum sulfurireducens]ALG83011.1 cysteine desulfurase [Halanaeroarchaeum sulfurireducens]
MKVYERSPLDVAAVRADFPILDREVGEDTPLVYLDNAATTQTPEPVIDAISRYYREYNANVHRGIHTLSQEASLAYEAAHDRMADLIGAPGGREEIVFTKNTTEAINLVAYSWGLSNLGAGDAVVLTEMEHHASLVTWQQIAQRAGAEVRYVRVEDDGRLDLDHAGELIDDDVAMVSAVHASNVLGTVNPLDELAAMAHEHDALILGDGAQTVPNRPVDVAALDVDFFAFSGHKMAGPTGIGVLWARESILEEMEPFLYGGEMIREVTWETATYNELPWKFEAGTPPIAEAVGLAAAADYLDDVGFETIQAHEDYVARYALERLEEREDVRVFGPGPEVDRTGLVSFQMEGIHAHDLSSILNDHGVAVRAGHHCVQPLHRKLGVPATARASFYLYNTREEVEALLDGLDAARDIFG